MPARHRATESPSRLPDLSRRTFLTATALGTGMLATGLGAGAARAVTRKPGSRNTEFIGRRRHNLILQGRHFRRSGADAYYLPFKPPAVTDAVMGTAAAMSLGIIRTWAFADGTADRPMQSGPRDYVRGGLDGLDYAVMQAGRHGLRMVLTLVNNWDDYGGMNAYVRWFGAAGHDEFFTRADIRACYRDWVSHVVTHVNRYTGVPYNQDPTIMSWELANEPRCASDRSGDTLVRWADEMSRHVHAVAPRQLVAVGDEGFIPTPGGDYPHTSFEGVDWRRLTALPAVDYGTVHVYPESWNVQPTVDWGTRWIAEHARLGYRMRKPVVIEEYAVADRGVRDEAMRAWTHAMRAESITADTFWLLTVDGDGTGGEAASGMNVAAGGTTAAILAEHARAMAAAPMA